MQGDMGPSAMSQLLGSLLLCTPVLPRGMHLGVPHIPRLLLPGGLTFHILGLPRGPLEVPSDPVRLWALCLGEKARAGTDPGYPQPLLFQGPGTVPGT